MDLSKRDVKTESLGACGAGLKKPENSGTSRRIQLHVQEPLATSLQTHR